MGSSRPKPSIPHIPSRNFAGSNHTEVAKLPHHSDTFSVVICGESGSGKSSLVNLIAGAHTAVTSDGAGGCTTTTNVYDVLILNETLKVKLSDTVGLGEGPRGTVPDKDARRILKRLLRTLTEQGDIHLVMYCVQGGKEIRSLRQNYQLIRSQVERKVPIVLVVTCLESYQPEMEDWWRDNERTVSKLGMTFAGHACITTTTTMTKYMDVQRRTHSYDAVCELINQCRPSNDTGIHTGSSLDTVHPSASGNKYPNVGIFGQAGAGKFFKAITGSLTNPFVKRRSPLS
ncbi:P-loop containing nucleoside triphosphate hydrolase protein [Suillus fuscotomentosus]|uniref:P-loop containing nucleoside triphosphate hydrolase protein n=1 Tax=Suillus fuscotomentosus TaxID=1912939 RepID=A0AAD4EAI9_9AGAM|nr:P-loop containing nucleoside triphosphate hydrolase protein [Suillus fuscotomentosus]KAG1902387.1 P-loop containing nucleoside triphosphate hydrolase protein [Suillus fuscotomentosus]